MSKLAFNGLNGSHKKRDQRQLLGGHSNHFMSFACIRFQATSYFLFQKRVIIFQTCVRKQRWKSYGVRIKKSLDKFNHRLYVKYFLYVTYNSILNLSIHFKFLKKDTCVHFFVPLGYAKHFRKHWYMSGVDGYDITGNKMRAKPTTKADIL